MENKKWYKSQYFNLLPTLRVVKGTPTSCAHFHFSWLFLNVWSMINVKFEVSAFAFGAFGFGMSVQLPYLSVVLSIPIPQYIDDYWWRLTERKPNKSH